MNTCKHKDIELINPHELIRKYRCHSCGEVMMCHCDKEIGTRFLSHQISQAKDLNSQCRVDVTKGFQKGICNECRGIKVVAFPRAEIYGRSSKIYRYYWREISFETMKRFASVVNCTDRDVVTEMAMNQKLYNQIEKEVAKDINKLHKECPKYHYAQESAAEVIKKYNVRTVNLKGNYVKTDARKVKIEKEGSLYSAEGFAENHLRRKGYKIIHSESIPFHVLFGIFMWGVIQDESDEKCRMVGFGDRFAFEAGRENQDIWTLLPEDFGTPEYYLRRKGRVTSHLESLPNHTEGLLDLFNLWVNPSSYFRQYLWAHKQDDVEKAKAILGILPVQVVINILEFLAKDYWGRYLGWPDIIAYKNNYIEFYEVKSSKDKLRDNQKTWIEGNYKYLKLPFSIIKIHKNNV